MIYFDSTTVSGVQPALLGMRNPMNSWDKSDSIFENGRCFIGKNDRKLIRSLVKAGKDHRKFLRMITVHINITAPLYWWKEFDTYKVGTVANSCSTMHKIHDKEFELDDFSHENFTPYNTDIDGVGILKDVINMLNQSRDLYLKTKDKKYWWNMIQLLPSSYNQKRTIMLNFETMINIYDSRKNHKLDEWHYFCDWIEDVLYQSGFACILDLDVIKTENKKLDDNADKIIAVDFDGTLCTNEYPKIGEKIQATFDYLFEEIDKGSKIILWTCRSGELLLDAVKWCDKNGLIFDAVNENLQECINEYGGDTIKIYADEYIDDKNKHICNCKNRCGSTSEKTSDIHDEKQPNRVINSNTYIEYVKRTVNSYLSSKEQLTNGLMGLSGESGEALDILKKTLFQDHPLDREKIALELGDVMWYLTMSADVIGYTLNDILKMNVEKLEKRYPDGFLAKNSINREE